jgi:hypothetical protein
MYWLSGDQNGYAASSVPARGWAASEFIGRSQSWTLASLEALITK